MDKAVHFKLGPNGLDRAGCSSSNIWKWQVVRVSLNDLNIFLNLSTLILSLKSFKCSCLKDLIFMREKKTLIILCLSFYFLMALLTCLQERDDSSISLLIPLKAENIFT
jgi:hypothetical protein